MLYDSAVDWLFWSRLTERDYLFYYSCSPFGTSAWNIICKYKVCDKQPFILLLESNIVWFESQISVANRIPCLTPPLPLER